eukprot:1989095-Pleurochrysis_carterae.AAC.1
MDVQVGCRMGCAFCETGRMGLLRNLSASEIVAQANVFGDRAARIFPRELPIANVFGACCGMRTIASVDVVSTVDSSCKARSTEAFFNSRAQSARSCRKS